MVKIEDIPFVLPIANWIWGQHPSTVVDDETDHNDTVSGRICLQQFPLLSIACWKGLFVKGLGVMIILGSTFNKLPIMINILKSKSAIGLSRFSFYGETIVYANAAIYGYLSKYPITEYGENVSLLCQNIVLIVMTWYFLNHNTIKSKSDDDDDDKYNKTTTKTKSVSTKEQIGVVTGFLIYVTTMIFYLPSDYWYLLMSTTWPIMLYARGTQVMTTYKEKQTGNLSIVTTTMNLGGSIIRIITTLQETGDLIVLFGYLLSGGLSLIMFIQYFWYLSNTLKKTQ